MDFFYFSLGEKGYSKISYDNFQWKYQKYSNFESRPRSLKVIRVYFVYSFTYNEILKTKNMPINERTLLWYQYQKKKKPVFKVAPTN